jgi:2-keto-4-pentenoate hydratase/2-oxohepta-3-ene-1,7-dioic acid hydratase in catechol pathway
VQNSSDSNILQPGAYDLKAPISDPQKLICVGLNYRDHCTEEGMEIPKEPLIFSKFNTAITGPNDAIELPDIVKVNGSDSIPE